MIKKLMISAVLVATIGVIVSIPAVATSEIELTNLTPTVKTVNLRLVGTEREQVAIQRLRTMVKKILKNSKLGVVRLPVSEDFSAATVMKVVQKLEIVIRVKAPLQAMQPHKVTVILQEFGTQGTPYHLNYWLNQPNKFYQKLKSYLTKRLNLRAIKPRTQPIQPRIAKKPQPVLHGVADKQARRTQTVAAYKQPIEDSSRLLDNDPENVSSNTEVQLKNMTPAVKSISIMLKGTQREQEILDDLRDMVNDILSSSRLGVVRIPISDDPVATTVMKVYEYLEIIIHAKSPAKQGDAYKVFITLQERGSKEEPKLFKYKPKDWWYFYQNLRTYLTKELNLQPK